MWNFAGRQNDIQGNGELEHGNWLSGFDWFDNLRLGDQNTLPDELKDNKGHNVFYCLPLLLGLIGLFWQSWYSRKNRIVVDGKEKTEIEPVGIRQFWVVFFLFFMTGLAIVIYLNQTPMQPRERDYAYAGSFYAFAIWCGMGVAALIDLIQRKLKINPITIGTIVTIVTILVPIQMASQTWDDHDRSGRYTCRDFGQNYLMSLQDEGNPIIFTNGDNDTFPLWYNQDVEGVRTDARVCNLSYLQTDWYIDQMCRPAYDSPSVPISWSRLEYCSGTNEYVSIDPEMKQAVLDLYAEDPETAKKQFGDDPFELKNILKYWVRSKNADLHVIPTDVIYMTIDKDAVRRSGMMMATDSIPDRMTISLKGKTALYKGDLMILEMLSQCNWERPIYVAVSVGDENYINLGDNTITEGLAYRITPFTTNQEGAKNFDTKRTYDNVMHRFKFGGASTKGVYLDETVLRMCYTHRRIMARLAMQLVSEGDDKKAAEVLRYTEKVLPAYNIPHSYTSGSLDMARAWAAMGNNKEAMKLIDQLWKNSTQYVTWYVNLDSQQFALSEDSCYMHIYILNQLLQLGSTIDEQWGSKKEAVLNKMLDAFQAKGGQLGAEN
jgi:phage shock protein PspC (stress-responsive transcriptional regulator)